MKYIYTVDVPKMEATYLENAQRELFNSDEQRSKFNAELVIEADSEDEALQMRIGMSDIRMWNLDRTEQV
jgi:hypothetical protein